jgi:mono/diheme cytochrome c family protein
MLNKLIPKTLFLWGVLVLFVSCQGQAKPNPSESGVLDGVPSIGETLGTPLSTAPPLPTADPEVLALGKQVYDLNCAACHGANLEGQPDWQTPNPDGSFKAPPHNEDGHTWHHSDQVLIGTILQGGARLTGTMSGASNMPAFEDILSEAEITAVLAYIKSTWPADIRQVQWERTAVDQIQ